MNSRERVLAVSFLVLLLVGGGGVCGYMFVYSPLQAKKATTAKLESDVEDLESKVDRMIKAAPQVAALKRQSLPPDPVDPRDPKKPNEFHFAKVQYKLMLERLLAQANINDFKFPTEKHVVGRAPITPEMAPKVPAYTTLIFQVDINRADIWQVVDFLYGFYQLDLLHQITDLKITRENKPTEARNGLKVLVTCEAIVLDGVEPRTSLFPVGSAVAAVGGFGAVQAVIARPEMTRRLTTVSSTPILSTRNRDYSLIAQNDIFYGPIPDYVPPKVRPFAFDGLPTTVTMKRDEETQELRVKFTGEGSNAVSIAVSHDGSLFPEGELKVDYKNHVITLPAIDPEAPNSASSRVSIVATSKTGAVIKGSFSVYGEKLEAPPKPVIVIDSAIRLVIVSTGSDGSATAVIKDNFTPLRYEMRIAAGAIDISKWWQATGKTWRKDPDYTHGPGMLVISDEESSTKRTFKIVAIEHSALIVCELETAAAPPAKEARPPGKGGGKFPPMGGKFPVKGGDKAFADPLAAIAGNLAIVNPNYLILAGTHRFTAALVAAIPTPTYYRWSGGKSLKELIKLTPEEVEEVKRRIAENGPVGPAIADAANGH